MCSHGVPTHNVAGPDLSNVVGVEVEDFERVVLGEALGNELGSLVTNLVIPDIKLLEHPIVRQQCLHRKRVGDDGGLVEQASCRLGATVSPS
jgi:hypothetical protein